MLASIVLKTTLIKPGSEISPIQLELDRSDSDLGKKIVNISDHFVSRLKTYTCEKRAGLMNTFPRRAYIAQSKKARIY